MVGRAGFEPATNGLKIHCLDRDYFAREAAGKYVIQYVLPEPVENRPSKYSEIRTFGLTVDLHSMLNKMNSS